MGFGVSQPCWTFCDAMILLNKGSLAHAPIKEERLQAAVKCF